MSPPLLPLPKPKLRIPSWQRDAITGEPLPKHPDLVFPIYEPVTPDDPITHDPMSIPRQLHWRKEEPGVDVPERMGSPEWTPAFRKYMGAVRSKEETEWRKWWTSQYVVNRLYARFPYEAVDAVLAVKDGHWFEDVASYYHRSPWWLQRWEFRMTRYVRQFLLPHEKPRLHA